MRDWQIHRWKSTLGNRNFQKREKKCNVLGRRGSKTINSAPKGGTSRIGNLLYGAPTNHPSTLPMKYFIFALFATSLMLQAEDTPPASGDSNGAAKVKSLLGNLLKKIDKDGNGKLDDSEKEALHGKVKKEILDRYDADHDGKLSPEEKAKAKADGQAKIDGEGKQSDLEKKARAEFNKRFDKDGDGKLNEEEKKAALDSAKKLREKVDPKKKPKADSTPAPTAVPAPTTPAEPPTPKKTP